MISVCLTFTTLDFFILQSFNSRFNLPHGPARVPYNCVRCGEIVSLSSTSCQAYLPGGVLQILRANSTACVAVMFSRRIRSTVNSLNNTAT
jgi:hypothetical protein